MTYNIPRILTIAGSDCSGGAGIQADLKSILAAGGYGMSALTALTAQNTTGVQSVHVPPQEFLRAQLESIASDVSIDAVKIGMLANAEICAVVADFLAHLPTHTPVVLDPVMVATSGDELLDASAQDALRSLCPRATVITPNLKELAVLTGQPEPSDFDTAATLATTWAQSTNVAVVVKGGHLTGPQADNAWVSPTGEVHRVASPRVDTPHTHGTGCSLSAALATRLAHGEAGPQALHWATRWLNEAIAHAAELHVGNSPQSHGPVNHNYRLAHQAALCDSTYNPAAPAPATPTPDPVVSAAGPHTQALWEAAAQHWLGICELDFIRGLAAGTVPKEDFDFYLAQDALYLNSYAVALSGVAQRDGVAAHEAAFWQASSVECVEEEASLHRNWLGSRPTLAPSRVTRAYTDFLVATTHTDTYAVAAAAVLPCFWLYAAVGKLLADANHPNHPYTAWLSVYGGEDFLDSTRQAIELVEHALESADTPTRRRAQDAFCLASRHEVDFFDQASRRYGTGGAEVR